MVATTSNLSFIRDTYAMDRSLKMSMRSLIFTIALVVFGSSLTSSFRLVESFKGLKYITSSSTIINSNLQLSILKARKIEDEEATFGKGDDAKGNKMSGSKSNRKKDTRKPSSIMQNDAKDSSISNSVASTADVKNTNTVVGGKSVEEDLPSELINPVVETVFTTAASDNIFANGEFGTVAYSPSTSDPATGASTEVDAGGNREDRRKASRVGTNELAKTGTDYEGESAEFSRLFIVLLHISSEHF